MKKIGLWIFKTIRIVVCIVLLFASCLATLIAIALKDSPYMVYDISDSKKLEDSITTICDNIPWPSTLPDNTKILNFRYYQHTFDAESSYISVTVQVPSDETVNSSALPDGYHISHNEIQRKYRLIQFYYYCSPMAMGSLYDWIVENSKRIYDVKEIILSFLPAIGLLLAAVLVVIPYGKVHRYIKTRKKLPKK